jgi:type I restriction enzyme S subunit
MRADIINDTNERITEIGVRGSNVKRVPTGTPLMSFKLTVGRVAIAGTDLFTNEAIAAFHVDENEVSPRWLFHLLPSAASMVVTDSAIKGATLNKAKLQMMELVHPPLPEQRRIAEILDTLDEAIRKTEQVIAKLQQMKQGLLHDLLTRGIDENGELRDPERHPERHPEQFKDSPLGRIPRGWEVRRLDDVVRDSKGLIQTGPFGSQLHAHEYVAEGIPVIMPQDIQGDSIDSIHIARITPRKARELGRHQLKVNDLVIARRGDLSRCVAIGVNNNDWLCGTGCLLARTPESSMIADWLASVYRHDLGQRQILAQAVGSTMINLNGKILARLLVPVPSPAEQRQCIDRMSAIKKMLFTEQSDLEKLRNLKQGLMDDLLTCRVRVKPEEAE